MKAAAPAAAAAVAVLLLSGWAAAGEAAPSMVSSRAHQLFLALDADGDHRVSAEEVARPESLLQLAEYFPESGGAEEFVRFAEAADTNGDGMLDAHELDFALHSGLRQSPEFLQLDAVSGRTGLFKKLKNSSVGKFVGKVWNGAKKAVTGFFGIDPKKLSGKNKKDDKAGDPNEACVMCQYIVERMETNVKNAGLAPSPEGQDYYSNALRESQQADAQPASFLETGAREGAGDPFGMPAYTNARRSAVHNQRLAERAKYNQIYRAADITLDDVCEQGMPDQYYKHCKSIYTIQSDVVDGLRYQYRPSDICFKVGMCAEGSYITKGIHNQRRFEAIKKAQKQADLYETCKDPLTC